VPGRFEAAEISRPGVLVCGGFRKEAAHIRGFTFQLLYLGPMSAMGLQIVDQVKNLQGFGLEAASTDASW
jgi:hypothetical protein